MFDRRRTRFALVATVVMLAAAPLSAQQDARFLPDTPVPVDTSVTVGHLENGLTYYIRRNSRPEQRAELRLVVNAGSVLEDDDQRGLAHLVEHMAFNGTRSFERQELVHYLESIGMRFGPDLNAYTGFDETVYMLTIPTDDPAIMETAFRILDEWASGVTFDGDEIDRERGVVIEEWRGGRDAGARVQDQQFPVLLRGSRYAERLPIGLPETLATFPHDALRRFYRDWYRPELMAVVAVGDFDPDVVERLIRQNFSDNVGTGAERPVFDVPGHDEVLFHAVADPELTLTQIQIFHKRPREPMTTVGHYREAILERLYNSMLNARLSEITQKPNAPFLAAASQGGAFVRTADAYVLQAIVADGGVERGLEAVLTEAERVARYGFTASELERTKLNMLRSLERANIERERTNSSSHASEYVNNYLEGEPIPGIEYEYALAQSLFAGITVEEINALSRELMQDANRVILVSAPRKEGLELPDLADVLAVVERVEVAAIEPYEDNAIDQPLLASLPAGSTIVEEIAHPEVGVTEWRLGNGVRVLLKATDFREDEIVMRAFSPGGTSVVSDDDFLSAAIATDVTGVSGVGPFSAVDLRRVLAGKAAGVAPSIGTLEEGMSGSASPRDLETMLQLVYLHFTEPRLDPDAVEALLEQARAVYANREADPGTAFSDTFTVTINQNHPRARPLTLADLDRLDPEAALAIYRDRFADAGDFTFVFVGNLNLADLRPLVQTYLGGLPSTGREETWRDLGIRPPGGVVEKVVRQGIEPTAVTRIVFTGDAEYTVEDAHIIRSLGSVLSMRLRESLREDLSGTYGVSVGGQLASRPYESFSVTVSFGADPQRIEELVDTLFADIQRLKQDGPSEQHIASVREMQRRERETSLRTNGFWADAISGTVRSDRDLETILDFDALVQGVTADAIREAAQKWLPEDNYVRVTLMPADSAAP